MPKFKQTDAKWRAQLTKEQYRVTRQKGTERAFSGEYESCKSPGHYHCVCCGQPLFHSMHKYDSGSGWPSFTQPISTTALAEREDKSLFRRTRTEVVCQHCDAHLGHVFPDGPKEATGLRYCINSVALKLEPEEDES